MLHSREEVFLSALRLRSSIGNAKWLYLNRNTMRNALPDSWTPVRDSSLQLKIGFTLTVAGVEWRKTLDLILAARWFVEVGIAEAVPGSRGSLTDLDSLIVRKPR